MNKYLFVRRNGEIKATVDAKSLAIEKPASLSQDGIAWGEYSDKSDNLAYSILLTCGDKATAKVLCKDFASDILSPLSIDEWEMSSEHIQQYIQYRYAVRYQTQQHPWTIIGDTDRKSSSPPVIPIPQFPEFLGNVNESLAFKK